jgi:hypothetical protein
MTLKMMTEYSQKGALLLKRFNSKHGLRASIFKKIAFEYIREICVCRIKQKYCVLEQTNKKLICLRAVKYKFQFDCIEIFICFFTFGPCTNHCNLESNLIPSLTLTEDFELNTSSLNSMLVNIL